MEESGKNVRKRGPRGGALQHDTETRTPGGRSRSLSLKLPLFSRNVGKKKKTATERGKNIPVGGNAQLTQAGP